MKDYKNTERENTIRKYLNPKIGEELNNIENIKHKKDDPSSFKINKSFIKSPRKSRILSTEFNVKFRKPSQMSKPCTSRITNSKVVKKRGGSHPKIKTKKPFSKLKLENKTNLILNYFEPSKGGRKCESDQSKNRHKVEDENFVLKPSLRSLVEIDPIRRK